MRRRGIVSHPIVTTFRNACALIAAIALCAVAAADPRPLSEAEEAAVRLAVAHLRSGPAALWDATSATSALRKLGREQGTKEIELRVGPPAGAEWELVTTGRASASSLAAFHVTFESGIDDTIVFTMAREGSGWRIGDVRSMSDVSLNAPAADEAPAKAPVEAAKPAPLLLIGSGVAVLLFAALTVALRGRSRLASNVLAGLTVVVLAIAGAAFYVNYREANSTRVAAASVIPVSPEAARDTLVDLRRRAASGQDLSGARRLDDSSADRAALWTAQLLLQRNEVAAAERSLKNVKRKNETPLAQILAGRMAFLQNRDVDAVLAYERAMELGPERDDLLFETASVLMTLGFNDRAERYFRKLAELGSRESDAYYSLAALEAMKSADDASEKHLFTAFRMRPELRTRLVRIGVLYSLLRKPAVRQQFAMHQSDEPLIRPARFAERPLDIPPGAATRAIGEHLEVDLIGSKLQIPGGAFMALPSTPVLDAGAWDRSDAAHALTSAPVLAGAAGNESTYAQPALARRIVETASALAAHHRWNDVAALTSGITPSFDLVPADLLLMKAEAQKRIGRVDTARTLLREVLARPALLKRLDGRQLLEAAEMLAALEDYDLAIRLMERAASLRELPQIDDRIRQLMMDKRLAQFSRHETPNFVIRYAPEAGPAGAQNVALIAEAELKRLQKWIPIADFKPVIINVLSWDTFRGVYTGSDHILGFYDGQITIPFAEVGYYSPEIVAILSHELAHAMIAQRTRDQAPRWFQEGLAQRVESVQFKRNPFNMYDPEQLLAFSLVDDVVTYSPDPAQIGQGYLVSHALIRYIEGRYGQAGLVRLLDGFAAGSPTEEAIEKLSGGSLSSFDEAFVGWGSGRREVFENTDLVSYEGNHLNIEMRQRRK